MFAFAYRLFHEDFSPIDGALILSSYVRDRYCHFSTYIEGIVEDSACILYALFVSAGISCFPQFLSRHSTRASKASHWPLHEVNSPTSTATSVNSVYTTWWRLLYINSWSTQIWLITWASWDRKELSYCMGFPLLGLVMLVLVCIHRCCVNP